jgi:hypothetical protein
MAQNSLRNVPLVAALLGVVVTGLGHLYLRRWLRAIGWIGVSVAASTLFVPESTISVFSSETLNGPVSALPIVLISALSVIDAYLIATVRRRTENTQADNPVGPAGSNESLACPNCRKPVDPDLGFCHWCTAEFDGQDITEDKRPDNNQPN